MSGNLAIAPEEKPVRVQKEEGIILEHIEYSGGTGKLSHSRIRITVDGRHHETAWSGRGMVNTIIKTIGQVVPHVANVSGFAVKTLAEKSSESVAEATFDLERNGRHFRGAGKDADTVVAIARAYVAALNEMRT